MGAQLCSCDTGRPYEDCCGRVHENGAGLGTAAVDLMRARYSAFVRGDEEFLQHSWHPETRPDRIGLDRRIEWLGLEIVATERGTGLDTDGVVEFCARYRIDARHGELRERSSFARIDGKWVYLTGNGDS